MNTEKTKYLFTVIKFGGSSLANYSLVDCAAQIVLKRVDSNSKVIVVVSAMGDETDKILSSVQDCIGSLSDFEDEQSYKREVDVLLSQGEQKSASLLALCLLKRNCIACSLSGWQLPIMTRGPHGNARIVSIDTSAIWNNSSQVFIITGFQGIDESTRNVTTLGRGGSDTTAVALAHALGARDCFIYSDVEGVFSCDPRVVQEASPRKYVAYEEMLEMSSLGAQVLDSRSVSLAMYYDIRINVLSSLRKDSHKGTWIVSKDIVKIDNKVITGITCSHHIMQITMEGTMNDIEKIFLFLFEKSINIDMIMYLPVVEDIYRVSFTVDQDSGKDISKILSRRTCSLYKNFVSCKENCAKVSLIGLGMRDNYGVAQSMFTTLVKEGVNVYNISTSELSISILVDEKKGDDCVSFLSKKFELQQ